MPKITEKDLGLTKLLQKFEGCNFLGHSVVTAELAINGWSVTSGTTNTGLCGLRGINVQGS